MDRIVKCCWWCPTSGSYDYLSSGFVEVKPDFDYMRQVAIDCEEFGFDDTIIPVSSHCFDPIVVTSFLGNVTSNLRFLVAFRPSYWNPVYFARCIASLVKLYGNRIAINLVEGNINENVQEGDILPANKRYARQEEFLNIIHSLWSGEMVNSKGIYNLFDCKLPVSIIPNSIPDIMISGHSEQALDLVVNKAKALLIFGCSRSKAADFVSNLKTREKYRSDYHVIGMAINIIARETHEEAVSAAEKFVSQVSVKHQMRILDYNEKNPIIDGVHYQKLVSDEYWMSPVLWYGIAKGKTHQRASLVGSYEEIANEIKEYIKIGFNYFIFTGYPNLEELAHIGKNIIPLLK